MSPTAEKESMFASYYYYYLKEMTK